MKIIKLFITLLIFSCVSNLFAIKTKTDAITKTLQVNSDHLDVGPVSLKQKLNMEKHLERRSNLNKALSGAIIKLKDAVSLLQLSKRERKHHRKNLKHPNSELRTVLDHASRGINDVVALIDQMDANKEVAIIDQSEASTKEEKVSDQIVVPTTCAPPTISPEIESVIAKTSAPQEVDDVNDQEEDADYQEEEKEEEINGNIDQNEKIDKTEEKVESDDEKVDKGEDSASQGDSINSEDSV